VSVVSASDVALRSARDAVVSAAAGGADSFVVLLLLCTSNTIFLWLIQIHAHGVRGTEERVDPIPRLLRRDLLPTLPPELVRVPTQGKPELARSLYDVLPNRVTTLLQLLQTYTTADIVYEKMD
jgi:hypothetical protein